MESIVDVSKTIHRLYADALMGDNIFNLNDWLSIYSAKLDGKELDKIFRFPWSEAILNSPCPFNNDKLVKETHFALIGMPGIKSSPLTVAKWLELHPATGHPRFFFDKHPWHKGQPHTDITTMELRWYLILKEVIPNSINKTPEEQIALLPPEYEVPNTITEVSKDILVFSKTHVRPNGSVLSACSEQKIKTDDAPDGRISCVGRFNVNGLVVDYWSGVNIFEVGIGASRLPGQ